MNLINSLNGDIIKALGCLSKQHGLVELDTSKVVLEKPNNPDHGDLALNAALVLAKQFSCAPLKLAQLIKTQLESLPQISNVQIAGPGFLNIKLKNSYLHQEIISILASSLQYGNSFRADNCQINVEYVSTNPTGPMHIGHGRNAVFGDVVANLLTKVGHQVTREYFINDAGGQTIALAKSLHLRYLEFCGKKINQSDFNEDMYRGEYLIPAAQSFYKLVGEKYLGEPESVWLEPIRLFAIEAMMAIIAQNLESLGIKMDVYVSEMEVVSGGYIDKALSILQANNDLYRGTLDCPKEQQFEQPSDNATDPIPLPEAEQATEHQLIFRATNYGDDSDRVLQKANGAYTYFAGDIGYHYFKLTRNYDKLINILGFDHVGYIKRLKAAVGALNRSVDLTIKTTQMVNFMDGGEPLRMSKRAGTFVTIEDLINKVGVDLVRFMMVSRHQDMPIDFDFEKVVATTSDNHLFYIQYANARIHSVLRHAATLNFADTPVEQINVDQLSCLQDEAELNLIINMIRWPLCVNQAALHLEPHRICNYLYDLAGHFHGLWNKGKLNSELRFIDINNKSESWARILLLRACSNIIVEGLNILGITPLDELR